MSVLLLLKAISVILLDYFVCTHLWRMFCGPTVDILLAGLVHVQNILVPITGGVQGASSWGFSICSGNDTSERIWHFFFRGGIHCSLLN